MKKYIIAGALGFLIHATWMIGSGIFLSSDSPANITGVYIEIIDKKPIFVSFLYAFLVSLAFVGIMRILLARAHYGAKEKWLLSLTAGAGFHLAFWALVGFLWAMFSGFGF